jgi:hypothetical protein
MEKRTPRGPWYSYVSPLVPMWESSPASSAR